MADSDGRLTRCRPGWKRQVAGKFFLDTDDPQPVDPLCSGRGACSSRTMARVSSVRAHLGSLAFDAVRMAWSRTGHTSGRWTMRARGMNGMSHSPLAPRVLERTLYERLAQWRGCGIQASEFQATVRLRYGYFAAVCHAGLASYRRRLQR